MSVWTGRMGGAGLASLAISACTTVNAVARQIAADSGDAAGGAIERVVNGETWAKSGFISVAEKTRSAGGGSGGGIALAPCPQVVLTYSSHNFTSGGFIAEAGMVNTEIAAVSYVVAANQFPIHIDHIDVLVGTQSLANQVTEQWSVLVWEGPPNTGTLIYTIQSDGKNPPHIIASPPTNAVLLQAQVDPGDPDQIIVTDNGSHTFSVGYRIDMHNLSPTVGCSCGFGSLPAICCPPQQNQNLFPTVDLDSLSQPSRNWLFARTCPGGSPLCFSAGWFTNNQAGINHDWNIRVAYTPSGCVAATGACCVASGQCFDGLTAGQCQAQSGTYQGDNTNCSGVNCPIPTGACCINGGQSCSSLTQAQCVAQGGTYLGNNSLCGANSCKGACCIQASQTCLNTTQAGCTGANTFAGYGTSCSTYVCFPIGACCLPTGACAGSVSPAQCQAQGGVFQGNATTCQGVNCPVPNGACCIGTECFDRISQADCLSATGTWSGPNTICAGGPCGGQPCTGDDNADHTVNIDDLVRVITHWGACPGCVPPGNCIGDINDNCVVNIDDLVLVITHWGPCP